MSKKFEAISKLPVIPLQAAQAQKIGREDR
jgi:hypothetical protein